MALGAAAAAAGEEYEEVAGDEYEEFVDVGKAVGCGHDAEDDGEEEAEEEVVLGDRSGKKRRCVSSGGARGGRGGGGRGYRGVEGLILDGDEEDEEDDDDDEDDERADRDMQLLQEACLPVSGAPLPPSSEPPKDADEYLRQVQWERLHLPETVEADVQEKPFRKDNTQGQNRRGLLSRVRMLQACADQQLPYAPDWADDASAAFSDLRAACEAARGCDPQAGKTRLTFAAWREQLQTGSRPSTSVLTKQNFVSVNRLVTVAVEMLAEACAVDPDADEARDGGDDGPAAGAADGAHDENALDAERLDRLTEWVFAALAFLELPLFDDVQYQMQRLRRTCHRLVAKSKLANSRPDGVDKLGGETLHDAVVARASMLFVIVTKVFGQR